MNPRAVFPFRTLLLRLLLVLPGIVLTVALTVALAAHGPDANGSPSDGADELTKDSAGEVNLAGDGWELELTK